MPRRSILPQKRFHIFLYEQDLEFLEHRYGDGALPDNRIGVSSACREIIHAKVKQLRDREHRTLERMKQNVS